ncbi:hypothetical protein BGZ63DRAFT_399865 [Mariannaea sp. PMI_226]|nr:hypothetical protein BGZ63DRAFT_399865 [Mariannaea sp. PMI_226]
MSNFNVAVQPPKQAQVGRALYPPVIAHLSSSAVEDGYYYFAMASLTTAEDGEVSGANLDGTITVNAQAPSSDSSLVFVFPDLSVNARGSFILRIDVYKAALQGFSGTTLHDQVYTRSVTIRRGSVSYQKPASREADYIEALQAAGVAV